MPKDYGEAVKWYRKAAIQGNAWGQYNLGMMYEEGRGAPKNFVEAAKWYTLAAVKGDALAQTAIGRMYDAGQGVAQDYVKAYRWYNLAAAQGNSDAAQARDNLVLVMTREQIAEAQKGSRGESNKSYARSTSEPTRSPSVPKSGKSDFQVTKTQTQGQKLSPTQIFARFSTRVVLLVSTVRRSQVVGSGLILSTDGYVATNAHVVEDSESVRIVLPEKTVPFGARPSIAPSQIPAPARTIADRSPLSASLHYYSSEGDIAILKIEAKHLPAFDLDVGRVPQAGEKVFSIGNPRGLEHTITEGIASGVRELAGRLWIQHSAAISLGSSGGALISENGILLGMNTFVLKDSQNLNFAIPVGDLKNALIKANAATSPLPFPRRLPQADWSEAFAALRKKDYIRAIDLAKSAVSVGRAPNEHYAIIGMSYFALDRLEDAEIYLNQVMMSGTENDSFKQTARYFLARIKYEQYAANPSTSRRAALSNIIRNFLNASQTTVVSKQEEEAFRNWARDVVGRLNDLTGRWSDGDGALFRLFNRNDFQIAKRPNGTFDIMFVPHEGFPMMCSGSGVLADGDGVYAGTLTIGCVASQVSTSWQQQIALRLSPSEDFSRLTGTVSYGQLRGYGDSDVISTFRQTLRSITLPVLLVRR